MILISMALGACIRGTDDSCAYQRVEEVAQQDARNHQARNLLPLRPPAYGQRLLPMHMNGSKSASTMFAQELKVAWGT